MVATTTAERLMATATRKLHDFDPGGTTVVAIEWRPIKEFRRFLAAFVRTIGTSAVTFDIAVATDSSGTGAVAVIAHAVGSEPDAVEDQLYLECDAEQMREVLAASTHWSPRVSVATGTDEAVVLTEEADPTSRGPASPPTSSRRNGDRRAGLRGPTRPPPADECASSSSPRPRRSRSA